MFNDNAEQMASTLKDLSIVAMSFYKDLLLQGFSEDQAFTMLVEWEKAVLGVGKL